MAINFKALKIRSIDVDVTNECNFKCEYCYHYKTDTPPTGHILPSVKQKLIQALSANKSLSINFFGGEPLVAFDDIKDIVTISGIRKWGITSNLSLLDQEKKAFITKYRGSVHSSIDGCAEAHNMFRKSKGGNDTYELVKAGARIALEINPRGTARVTVMPESVQYLYKNVTALYEIGYRRIALMPVIEVKWTNEHWATYETEMMKIGDFIIKHPKVYIKNIYDSIRLGGKKKTRHCGAGFSMLAMSTNGLLWPCHRFTELEPNDWCLGNILNGNIDIAKLQEYRHSFEEVNEVCLNCQSAPGCNLGCPHTSYNVTGKLNEVMPVHCNYMRRSRAVAVKVYEKIKAVDGNIYTEILNRKKGNRKGTNSPRQKTRKGISNSVDASTLDIKSLEQSQAFKLFLKKAIKQTLIESLDEERGV
jgi:uncharacterized protein